MKKLINDPASAPEDVALWDDPVATAALNWGA
jgi:hypothetical protein